MNSGAKVISFSGTKEGDCAVKDGRRAGARSGGLAWLRGLRRRRAVLGLTGPPVVDVDGPVIVRVVKRIESKDGRWSGQTRLADA